MEIYLSVTFWFFRLTFLGCGLALWVYVSNVLIYVSQFLFCCQFKRGSILISKEPKRISKGLDDDDDNNDEDDVEELERKIRYGNFFKNVCSLVLQLCDYCWVHWLVTFWNSYQILFLIISLEGKKVVDLVVPLFCFPVHLKCNFEPFISQDLI